jgi:diguanylate cyclase (GGDEF)-like protein/PAS domain S-box-containing protein
MKARAHRTHDGAIRFYAALSRTNGAIARIREPRILFEEICAICVEQGNALMAYVVMADERGYARPVASAGPAAGFLRGIDLPLNPSLPGTQGPIALAMQRGEPYVANDLHADPHATPWRQRARRLGSKATAAFPIRRGGRVVGALSLHVAERDFFDAPLVALLREVVDHLAYALDNIDNEALRIAAVRESEVALERFRKIFQNSPVATAIWALEDGRLLESNDAYCALLGCTREDLFDANRRSEADRCGAELDVPGHIERLRAGHRVRDHELQLTTCSGVVRHVLLSAELIEFNDERCALTIIADVTERKIYESGLRHFATHDGLTGLPNRHVFCDRAMQALSHARRTRTLAVVLVIDLDRLKVVNDELGHQIGDMVLQLVGDRLRTVVRDGDCLARLGGDKFLVLLTDLPVESDAKARVGRICDAFSSPFWVLGHELHLTASVGVGIYPTDGSNVDELMRHADIAMYRAKQLGNGACQYFACEMAANVHPRLDLSTQLRRALDAGQLYLEYQPKIRLSDGAIAGAEALLRWRHPSLGVVSPGAFIPLAEETGMIVPIGEWVLGEACRQAALWQDERLPRVVMSVNVSARQLLRREFAETVLRALRAAGLAPEWLELEITESVIAEDAETVGRVIGELNDEGVRFAIDDFGTGYSSLSYLQRFRVDRLKIDQSFVRRIPQDSGSIAIVRAIISLARAMTLHVTAEGVETVEQYRFLEAEGCEEIQGYLFSRPVSAASFAAMLRGAMTRAMPLREAVVTPLPFAAGRSAKSH